jgi:hypothetical protein
VTLRVKFVESSGENTVRESSGLWPDGIEALFSLLKGFCKLKAQTTGKIWAVFAEWARMTDRFD